MEQLRTEIEKVEMCLNNKYKEQNMQFLVKRTILDYQDKQQTIKNQIALIQSFLSQKYSDYSLNQIICSLKKTYKQKIISLKKSNLYQIMLNDNNYKYLQNIIHAAQNMIIPQKNWTEQDLQQIEQEQESEQRINQTQAQLQLEQINEKYFGNFITNEQHQENSLIRYFQGEIVQQFVTLAKLDKDYLNQKKVVHVFIKKGYGLQKYQQYLLKRKLDQKQWNFYINDLKQNNNYQIYLNSAIKITLTTIVDFIKYFIKGYTNIIKIQKLIKQQNLLNLMNILYYLTQNEGKYFKDCIKIIFQLKINQKPSLKQLKQIIDKIISHIKH